MAVNRRKSLLITVGALLACGALVLFLRLPALPQSVIDWDESFYLLMAREMLRGHPPYTVIWDNKPPGLYVLFALTQVVLGQTVLAMRLLAVIVVTATSFLLWLFGRIVLGSGAIGALAALFYALFSTQNGGLASNAEIMFAPFTTGALLLVAVRAGLPATILPQRRLAFFAAGLLLGLAIQIKTVAGVELLAALAWIGLATGASRRAGQPAPIRAALLGAGLLALGALLPLLAAAGYFAISGHWGEYVYANFTALSIYLQAAPPLTLPLVTAAWLGQARGATLLWLAALAAAPLAWFIRRSHPRAALHLLALGVWLAFTLAATLLSRRFYPHYFLQVLPPLSLLAAAVIVQAVRLDSALPRVRQALLIGLIVAIGLAQPAARPLRHSLDEALALLRRTPRIELLTYTASYLRERMAPDDYLYVAEGDPILYYLTDARLPTRYLLPPLLNDDLSPMIGIDPLAELDRIMALRPRYVVLLEEYQRDPAFLIRLQSHLANDYELERSIQGILLYRLVS
jgi:4-amino-4-deoxy-L-arabinose transferase-like glycosyltransferase